VRPPLLPRRPPLHPLQRECADGDDGGAVVSPPGRVGASAAEDGGVVLVALRRVGRCVVGAVGVAALRVGFDESQCDVGGGGGGVGGICGGEFAAAASTISVDCVRVAILHSGCVWGGQREG